MCWLFSLITLRSDFRSQSAAMRVRPRVTGNGLRRKIIKDSEEFDNENGECKGVESRSTSDRLDEYLPLPSLTHRTASILISTVSLICYWNSCNGDFVFDDSEAIVNNRDLRPQTPFWKLFLHDFWGGTLTSNDSHKSYRPLTVLTYRWNYWLAGGLYPWGFHFVNVILHAVVSGLSLLVFNEVFKEELGKESSVSKTAFLCALVFAIHPIHTESVAGVVGRADLLCALCFFLSFLTYIKCCKLHDNNSQASLGYLLTSVTLCSLAMLFKEQGITVLGLCCAYDIIMFCKVDFLQLARKLFDSKKLLTTNEVETSSQFKGLICRQSILVLVGLILLLGRWRVMGSTPPKFQVSDNPASFEQYFISRFINYNYIYAINLWLLINPWWLCFDWSMGCIPLIKEPSDPRIITLALMWAILTVLIGYCIFGSPSHYKRICTMGLAFLMVPFLPASNIFFRVGFVIAERVLYLSSVGSCILVVLGIATISRKAALRNYVSCCIFAMIICFSLWTIKRSGQWMNEDLLFTSGETVCPLNAKVHYNIGKVRSNQNSEDEALRYYRESIRLNPTYHDALNNLGNLLKEKGEINEAEELLERAVKHSNTFAAGWMNLGTVKAAMNKMQEAEVCYKNAIKFRKKYPDAYFNLGNLYIDWEKSDEAISAFKSAVKLKKNHVGAWLNHILLLDKSEKRTEGIALARQALKHVPDESSIHFNLGNMLGQEKYFEEAEKHFLTAIKISPRVAEIQGNLGVLYHRWGKLDEAERQYQKALKLDPRGENIRENIEKLERTKERLKQQREV